MRACDRNTPYSIKYSYIGEVSFFMVSLFTLSSAKKHTCLLFGHIHSTFFKYLKNKLFPIHTLHQPNFKIPFLKIFLAYFLLKQYLLMYGKVVLKYLIVIQHTT